MGDKSISESLWYPHIDCSWIFVDCSSFTRIPAGWNRLATIISAKVWRRNFQKKLRRECRAKFFVQKGDKNIRVVSWWVDGRMKEANKRTHVISSPALNPDCRLAAPEHTSPPVAASTIVCSLGCNSERIRIMAGGVVLRGLPKGLRPRNPVQSQDFLPIKSDCDFQCELHLGGIGRLTTTIASNPSWASPPWEIKYSPI